MLLWWLLFVYICCSFSLEHDIDSDAVERIAITLKSPGKHQVHVPSKYNRMLISLTGACGGLNDHGAKLFFSQK